MRQRKRRWWRLIAWMCLTDRRALRHHNRHDEGFELGAAPDHSDLKLTNKGKL